MARSDSLRRYRGKRNLQRSPEPAGRHRGMGSGHRFVIQKHDASSLHYDFRLEVDGVLKSWAVPKGPSTDPREKRLAVQVEDHPLEYADFEGVIPEGSYGAGTVLVWDTGTYRNLSRTGEGDEVPLSRALRQGTAEIWLEGEKLRGGYALVHSRLGGKAENWLLVKMRDEGADARRNPVSTQPDSVKTGRSMAQVRAAGHPERRSGHDRA